MRGVDAGRGGGPFYFYFVHANYLLCCAVVEWLGGDGVAAK